MNDVSHRKVLKVMIFGYVGEHSVLRRCMLKYLKVKCHDICNLHFNGLANIYIYICCCLVTKSCLTLF